MLPGIDTPKAFLISAEGSVPGNRLVGVILRLKGLPHS
jgi:hypothetical protein